MKIFKEFKEFATRGNVIDLAVAVVIGGAFGKIVSSLVNDIIMPLVGVLLGGINFSSLTVTLKEARFGEEVTEAVVLNYGLFIQSLVDFLIIAWAIFIAIKAINKFKKKKEDEPKQEPAPSKQEVLLKEIRDILKEK